MPGTPSFDRRDFLKVAGTVGILSGSAETAAAQQSEGKRNELLVGIAPSANARQTAQRALPSEARIVGENDTLGYVRAELPERASATATASVANTVASRRGVEYAEPNAVYETLVVPNDPHFGDQYAPEMVNAPAAWDTTLGESDVTVAIVDQGIKYDHPDLAANVASDHGRDFVDDDDDPYPDSLADEHHGTHVAGIAAAGTDNDTGVAGISNATLLSVRALDETGSGYTSNIADGIQWAADNGADIINLSLGGGGFTETLQKAVSYAHEKGVLLVAAAGNDGGSVKYPAAYDECVAVSALDPDGSLASYSSRGPEIELAAPGTNLLSTWTDDGYETLSGTSMAAPVVSGIAALLLSRNDLSNETVRSRLKNTAGDIGLSAEKQGTGQVSGTVVGGRNTLSIESTGDTDRAEYRLSVESDLAKSTANGADRNSADTISGQTATGYITSGLDSYTFSGKIERFDLDGSADVFLNGERIDPANYPDDILSIRSNSGTDRAEYQFTVGSDLAKSTANGADRNSADTISGQTASGYVTSGLDSYAFSGTIAKFSLNGAADVLLNGDKIDPAEYPDNVLSIRSNPDTDRADYRFTVESDLAKSTANGADRNAADTISGQTATGYITSGLDSYTFSGKVERFDLDGSADVSLNGERIDPANYSGNVLSIRSNSGTDRAEYQFSVESELAKSTANGADRNSADTISGQTATGYITSGLDSYTFSGALKRFSLDGSADVVLNGSEIDPIEYTSNVLSIRSNPDTDRADYQFTVESDLAKSTANGADRNSADTISGQTASGYITSGLDSYTFSGKLHDITVDGNADVLLNDDRIDPADYSNNVLSIESNGGRFSYEFTVDAYLEKSTARGATIDDNDTISGNTATGQGGGGGTDSYTFSGELRNISVNGDATVYLNGTVISGDSPAIGVHNGLSDANFDTIDRMETWQSTDYDVQNLFVPWNPDEGHMNWLFDRILPQIWNAGRTPLITWEPYTPGARTASVDTQSLVERNEYNAYLESLADTTPDDIEVRIGNGDYDGYIDRWASRLQNALAKSSGRQAYLRLAHEMNGDWYPWSPTVGGSAPQSYVNMWRHVHDQFDQQGIGDDLQWMWCVNAEDVGSYTAEQLYPGNGYIDWQSVDGYNWGRSQSWSSWGSPDSIYGGMLDRLSSLGSKPICVAEFASSSKVSGGYDPQRKNEWIRDALAYFENRGVDLWCWFNEDKETDWAVFNGVRGTETVSHNGRQVNAYSAYREAIDSYATANGATAAESNVTEQGISDD